MWIPVPSTHKQVNGVRSNNHKREPPQIRDRESRTGFVPDSSTSPSFCVHEIQPLDNHTYPWSIEVHLSLHPILLHFVP